ncbi:hypothetical protein CEXT_261931 [Caerostris extrusa]|uniref:Uncharacterized protein n=1 Tax=Caerostris extrusa TaxID=172846 RepID=A0AAV4T364_CAEEX|nr:hypothetical protein CEXT_261931 [Caerostris extrusa]
MPLTVNWELFEASASHFLFFRNSGNDLSVPDSTGNDLTVPDSTGNDLTVPDSTGNDLTVPDSTGNDLTVPDYCLFKRKKEGGEYVFLTFYEPILEISFKVGRIFIRVVLKLDTGCDTGRGLPGTSKKMAVLE